MNEHRNHWLYKEARKLTEDVRVEQIRKGSEKYETPLGDAGWTPEQLVHHAMMENVDQAHYLTALMFEIKKMKQQNKRLIEALEAISNFKLGNALVFVQTLKETARHALQQEKE